MKENPPNPSARVVRAEYDGLDIISILRASLIFSFILSIITSIITFLINFPGWERFRMVSLVSFLWSLVLVLLLKRGYYRLVTYGAVWGFGAIAAYGSIMGLGVRGPIYAAFSIIVILGMLFHRRWVGYLIAVGAALLGLGLIWVFNTGLLPYANNPMPDLAIWANVSVYFFVTAILLDITLRQVDYALSKQAYAEKELRQLNAELENRIEKRTAQLTESQARYRLIAENASDIIWTTNLNLRITYISPSAESARGFSVEEMMQQSITETLTSSSYKNVMAIFSEEMSKANIQTDPDYYRMVDLEFTCKGDSTYWSETKVSFLRDEAGQPIGLLGVGRDINQRRQTEAALRESEERYRLISNLSSDYAFTSIVHANGVAEIEQITGSFEAISGYSMEELKLRGGWRSIIHPDSIAQDDQAVETLYANRPIDTELKIMTKNGEHRWVRFYAYPVWDKEQNRLVAIHGAGKDITSQKHAESREKRRREMLEKVIELGQLVTQQTDLDLCLAKIHHSIKNELGFDRVGFLLYDSITNEFQDAFAPNQIDDIEDSSWYLRAISEHETWSSVMKTPKGLTIIEEVSSTRQTRPDEKNLPKRQHATLAAWAGDKPVALITVDNTLTRQPLDEEKLEALKLFAGYAGLAIENARWNAQLEQRVVERTIELEVANRDLQDFTYTIAHDLRAPARAMIGFSRLLDEKLAGQLDENGQHYLNRVNYSAQRMGQMIDELLTFTRLGRQTLHKSRVNILVLVRHVLEEFEPERVKRQVEINIGDLPDSQADQEMLEQVWRNLINNAFKFTRQTARAKITIGATHENGHWQYFIRDNGVGFDKQYADKLFGVFSRLNLEEEYEGTGMGLAIVHRIIIRHGGRVWAEAEVNKGATFYFTLSEK